ncbi:hypothetical protein [Panacibacter ginsenosidivorans]|nr:hypothetical protein [Panacibacter ginsenosidivorans]
MSDGESYRAGKYDSNTDPGWCKYIQPININQVQDFEINKQSI